MPLSNGDKLGPYEILAPLGAGGMGEVYRARDPKLNRDVAIKVLPAALAGDAQYLARSEREAQMLAALNHPNIAAIYGIEQGAIVMELVEGADLKGPLPVEEAIGIARQIAAGLEAAHEKGIIHRDLKPANIKVTAQGVVKILDFGLAKASAETAAAAAASSASPTVAPTLSLAMTQAGMILGTAAYMSPEQARGKTVDRRTDIWAFGVVLYEMLTGRLLFAAGETVTDVIAAVVTREPDWSALPTTTPPHIRKLLQRCLRKDVKTRLQAIGEARIALDEPEPAPVVAVAAPRKSLLPWVVATAALGLAVVAFGGLYWRATRPPESRPLLRMNVEVSPDLLLQAGYDGGTLALSPDGRRLVVSLRSADGKIRLYTRLLNQVQMTPLAGTEDASQPVFSPDGQWIAFGAGSAIKKISLEGGSAVTLCEAPRPRGIAWGADGNIVFTPDPNRPLFRVSAAGGNPSPLTKLKEAERTHRWPQVLPGGESVLYTTHTQNSGYSEARIDVLSLKTGEIKTVHQGGFSGRYVTTPNGSGRLLYLHNSTLFAAPFDLKRLELTGAAVPVLDDVASNNYIGGDFAFSANGTFVYRSGIGEQSQRTIVWLDREGKRQPLHNAPGFFAMPRVSPDGKRLAFSLGKDNGYDLWVQDLDRDTPSRLSFMKGTTYNPVWTPDGQHIVFQSSDPSRPGMYWVRSDGAGEAVRLTDGKRDEVPSSISPDGKRLAFYAQGDGGTDIFTALVEGDPSRPTLGKPELFLGTPAIEVSPAFSPDGRWLAYMSRESGQPEIYVRAFPGPGGQRQISAAGGNFPVWSRDARELLFEAPDGRLMTVSYTAKGDSFQAGKPNPWPETSATIVNPWRSWDLAPDGRRLAMIRQAAIDEGPKPQAHLTFLLNFFDELDRRK